MNAIDAHPFAETPAPAKAGGKVLAPATITRSFVYNNFRGLHARPAALLVKSVAPFTSAITAECNGEKANAKSILGVLCLAVGCKSKVTFTATGSDAAKAMAVVEQLFEHQFNEAY